MYREFNIFCAALMFYTRIPCPPGAQFDPAYNHQSARYFTLIGWIVGAIAALTFYVSNLLFSSDIALVLSFIVGARVTGGFHEDGLADVCDGFGGGWSKERIMVIMKDSTLGTFGVLGLILITLLKFVSLKEFAAAEIPAMIIAGHALSRFTAARMLARGRYVQEKNQAKAGSAADKLPLSSLLANALMGLSAFLLFDSPYVMLALIPLLLTEASLFRFFSKWIGGYTGDCAGAVQQVSEVVFYLSVIALWKFI
ncbi:adenosylcobinamide-GDP ribazoletransferase [Aliagarivorans marinus]|uniref:adenosylcobinamide-GDP ribazoletransferase n=1 Tax=Aliagarivorans marinus TaxID=561965 RepID=UPI0004094B2E|nr:adenosylcobinamide-GDP ribazoletransferase [Aliagarivorans marinus]